MRKNINRVNRIKLKTYIKQNWGAPFVIGFMLLLVVAAALLAIGLSVPAEVVGAFAYFSLAAGAILQFACYLRSKKKQGVKKNGSK